MIARLGPTNAAVFQDMYWQHLAYQDGGIELLKAIAAKGQLDNRLLKAWTLISDGEAAGDGQKIQDGNLQLLLYEQEVVVQKYAFGDPPAAFAGYFMNYWSTTPSPVPGGKPFGGKKNIADLQDRLAWMPTVMQDFVDYMASHGDQAVNFLEGSITLGEKQRN